MNKTFLDIDIKIGKYKFSVVVDSNLEKPHIAKWGEFIAVTIGYIMFSVSY